MSRKIYIDNVSASSSEAELEAAFARCGRVQSVVIVTSHETGLRRGFAFVDMEDPSAVPEAVRALDGTVLGGRNIRVRAAHSTEGLPRQGH